MRNEDRELFDYIDHEVRDVCDAKEWGRQIRRKWSARERPVNQSDAGDYEWKLIPGSYGKHPEVPPNHFDEGIYYLLSFDESNNRFIIQHDTSHCGEWDLNWEQATYTEIHPDEIRIRFLSDWRQSPSSYPPSGWLRDHLLDPVSRFGPNYFSTT